MNYYEIIVALAILFGILLSGKTKSTYLRIIIAGLIASLLFSFFEAKLFINISFYGFWLFTVMAFALTVAREKWLISLIALFTILKFLWNALYWPFIGELQFLKIIPLICFALILKNWRKHLDYLSLVVVLSSVLLIEFISLISKWIK